MWIGVVCDLLAVSHGTSTHKLISIAGEKRTSAVGARYVLHLARLFRWIEGRR